MSDEQFDTVVIGAGQAGLAVGYYLARQRRNFVIVDAGERVGQTWDWRWDSLQLFTPAHFTHLPGMRFPGPRRRLPSKGEVADYLRSYATRFALPVRMGWRVDDLSRDDDGYVINSAGRDLRAHSVVVATGPAMRPRVPDVADQLDPSTVSVHSMNYRNPDQLRDGTVLVVGAGNSGAEIALDVAPAHSVILAGRDTGRLPVSIGGPLYRVMNLLLTADNFLGRRFMANVNADKGTPLVRVRPCDSQKPEWSACHGSLVRSRGAPGWRTAACSTSPTSFGAPDIGPTTCGSRYRDSLTTSATCASAGRGRRSPRSVLRRAPILVPDGVIAGRRRRAGCETRRPSHCPGLQRQT
jgi:putative flavoprotein involved in K+ transport